MERIVINVRKIPKQLWKRFKDRCDKKGMTLPYALSEAISDWLMKED